MGGHQTKQKIKETAKLTVDATLQSTQNCISYVSGSQIIGTYGSGNVVSGNIQNMSVSVTPTCFQTSKQKSDLSSEMQSKIKQSLKSKQVALTQWLDTGKSSTDTEIDRQITANFTFDTVQNCFVKISNTQLIVTKGSANVVIDNAQKQTSNVMEQCIMSGGQTSAAVSNITDTINQHSEYTSTNPLSFIGDFFKGMMQSGIMAAAAIFIGIIILVFVYEIARGGHKTAQPILVTPTSLTSI